MPFLTYIYSGLLALFGVALFCNVGYLLVLLAAAAFGRRGKNAARATIPTTRFVILVPAHDEEMVIAATLQSLREQEYPAHLYEVVVAADNCTDSTSTIARMSGATVLQRIDSDKRGKGYALDWAITKLLKRESPPDAVVVVDADTWVDPRFLWHAASALMSRVDAQGRCALQGRYGVLNTGDAWRATLMAAAFELFNHVKPLGRDALGLSVGLKGNGMVFTRPLLEQAHWRGDSVTEDIDFSLDLIRDHGVRVGYMPEARVLAQMPATAEQATSQRKRWEEGRYRLVRERGIALLLEGVRRRNAQLCDSAFNLLLLPLAELGFLWLVWMALIVAGAMFHVVPWMPWTILAGIAAGALLIYILGGLRVAKAPRAAYAALARAPLYAAWKMLLYARKITHPRTANDGEADEWIRTDRIPVSGTVAPPAAASEREVA